MSERHTCIYHKDNLIRQEKLCTLKEFCQMGRFQAGQHILIGEVDEHGRSSNTESFWIGNATPYHKPSTNDGGFGWYWEDPFMQKYVLEVNTY